MDSRRGGGGPLWGKLTLKNLTTNVDVLKGEVTQEKNTYMSLGGVDCVSPISQLQTAY